MSEVKKIKYRNKIYEATQDANGFWVSSDGMFFGKDVIVLGVEVTDEDSEAQA